jgi:replication-associated recombination protein RarA
MLDDALYYSREFIEAGQINYLFKRLFVMLVEDI